MDRVLLRLYAQLGRYPEELGVPLAIPLPHVYLTMHEPPGPDRFDSEEVSPMGAVRTATVALRHYSGSPGAWAYKLYRSDPDSAAVEFYP